MDDYTCKMMQMMVKSTFPLRSHTDQLPGRGIATSTQVVGKLSGNGGIEILT